MTPEAALFLEKARELLRQAGIMNGVGLYEAAGRNAYLAGFHAAQAVLFEKTGKVFKTHSGVHAEFARLTRNEGLTFVPGAEFLGRTYDLKTVADYATGPDARVTKEQAAEALESARMFLKSLADLLDDS